MSLRSQVCSASGRWTGRGGCWVTPGCGRVYPETVRAGLISPCRFALYEASMYEGDMQRPAGLEGKALLLPTVRKVSQLLLAAEASALPLLAARGATAVLASALRTAPDCEMRRQPAVEAAEAVQVRI